MANYYKYLMVFGIAISCGMSGCVTRGARDAEQPGIQRRVFTKENAGQPGGTSVQAAAKTDIPDEPPNYKSTGSGAPARREVPALILAYNPPPAPTPEPAAVATPPAPVQGASATTPEAGAVQEIPVPPPGTTASKIYRLKVYDTLIITMRGIPNAEQISLNVDESGYITLPYVDRIQAAGLTRAELEQNLRQAYLDKQIYRDTLSINVTIPTQSYFVRGEVRVPNRYPLIPGMTFLQAITAAGGYTEFANPRKIKVVRGDKFFFIDGKELEMQPERDQELEPGDIIIVPRSFI